MIVWGANEVRCIEKTLMGGPEWQDKEMASASSSSSYTSPCAACKFLRRKCLQNCLFAPHFPADEPQKFANVHKIFGASNVGKILNEVQPHQREDAVNSLAYEAEARVRDPVYGCVGAISYLQRQVQRLQKELDAANADIFRYACNEVVVPGGFDHSGFHAAAAGYEYPVGPWAAAALNQDENAGSS